MSGLVVAEGASVIAHVWIEAPAPDHDLKAMLSRIRELELAGELPNRKPKLSLAAVVKQRVEVALERVLKLVPCAHKRLQGRHCTNQAKNMGAKNLAFDVHGADVIRREAFQSGVVEGGEILGGAELLDQAFDNSELAHDSSPSVGAPSGAVCDNANPTDGELNPGAAVSSPAAAPAPSKTTVQE